MNFEKIDVDRLLNELTELQSDWMDETASQLTNYIKTAVQHLRDLKKAPTEIDLEKALEMDGRFLDVCRLFLGKGQEPVAHMICDSLKVPAMTWPRLRNIALAEPRRVAQALVDLGVTQRISEQMNHKWEIEDVLIERYKMSRGRAVAGQRRGRSLENDVEAVLKEIGAPFQRGVTFMGQKGITAKCDFAIPTKQHPKIIVESKGFEATGSKLTDFLGDVLKIGQAKEYHTYFFIVTDGRGWHNRQSDLRKIVDYHQDGLVDMIYTRARLSQLRDDVRHILENE